MEKLVFLYLLTNPLTNISGVYELPLKRVAFDTGISETELILMFNQFEANGKLIRDGAWVGIVNFIKHQSLNPKVKQGIVAELSKAPKSLADRLSIGFQSLSHLNSNLNNNPNSNAPFSGNLSTAIPQDIEIGRRELVRKWRI
jgi:hypothetical protein